MRKLLRAVALGVATLIGLTGCTAGVADPGEQVITV